MPALQEKITVIKGAEAVSGVLPPSALSWSRSHPPKRTPRGALQASCLCPSRFVCNSQKLVSRPNCLPFLFRNLC